ncbi:MAG: hypothetical protein NZ583_08355 [Desulfobacterota bacterium]|nr:hypothetical protein [Thermodesulfobacteriota bacterium]
MEKKGSNLITYSEKLSNVTYDETHPYKPHRAKVFLELLRRYSLVDDRFDTIVEPEKIDESLLLLFHEKEYVETLKRAEHEFDFEAYKRGIGTEDNPVFSGMFEFALSCVACTFTAFRKVIEDGIDFAFNPLGGYHHAERGYAMGFCYLNDVAVVGKYFLGMKKRFVILDIDAHHGNGIQDAFYADRDVLTISIHESGATLFPGTGSENELGEGEGYGYNVNIPLIAGSGDEVYLYAFESVVRPLIKSFSPDFLVVLIGTDLHKDDPMSHLNVTARGFKKTIEIVRELSDRIVALGAGGYSVSKSPALWTIAYSVFTKRKILDQYAGLVGGMMYGPEVDLFYFLNEEFEDNPKIKALSMKKAEEVVSFIKKNVFPIFGIS